RVLCRQLQFSQFLQKTAKSYRKSFCPRPTIAPVSFNHKIFADANILVTGGLGFIGSSLARRLVTLGAKVTLVDSLIPEYGGNLFNIDDIRDRVTVNVADVRDPHAMAWLVHGRHFLFKLAGQTSHIDSMTDPITDLNI